MKNAECRMMRGVSTGGRGGNGEGKAEGKMQNEK
jgi:hypothetical protein